MGKNIYIDKNQRELKQHGTIDFPFKIGEENILEYDNKRFNCHWHKEIEITLVYQGKMVYKVNEKEFTITEGDCLFINANALHMGWSIGNEPCIYHAMTMDPSILCQEKSELREKYVDPVLDCTAFTSLLIRAEKDWQLKLISILREIDTLYQKKSCCYEFEIISDIMKAWSLLYQNINSFLSQQNMPNRNVIRLKMILNFIHENYASRISLDDIARSANISKSECSHFFKQYMHESPFEYLLQYRIERSLPLLINEGKNITETAFNVGFPNSSYYTEIFKRYKGVTPREFKKIRGFW